MDEKIPFILALVGGIFGLVTSLGMGAMLLFVGALLPFAMDSMMPFAFVAAFLGWFLVVGVAGGVASLVGASKLHREPRSRSGAIWSLVGGGISILGGNMIAGALCIAAGAVVLSEGSRV